MNRDSVFKLCHVLPPFCLWNIPESWKIGCHFILSTVPGNSAMKVFKAPLENNEGENGLGNTKGKNGLGQWLERWSSTSQSGELTGCNWSKGKRFIQPRLLWATATIGVFGAWVSKPQEQIFKMELTVMRNRIKLKQNKPIHTRVCTVTVPAQTCPLNLGIAGTKSISFIWKIPLGSLCEALGLGSTLELVTSH